MSNVKIIVPADVYWENLDLQANQVNNQDFMEVEVPQTWYDNNESDIGPHYLSEEDGADVRILNCNPTS